jgi:AraC-like DNA-binding protein
MSYANAPAAPRLNWERHEFLRQLRPGQLLEGLFDEIPGTYFFFKDRESRFMGGNTNFARGLGVESVDRLIGQTDHDFSPDFLADAFLKDDRKVIENGQSIRNRIELVPTADGSLDWLITNKVPLYDQSGNIIGLAGVARRIRETEAVYAEHPEMRRIVDYVRKHYRSKLSVADMARVGGISTRSQERLFKRTFGLTPSLYLRKIRLNAACKHLRESSMKLSAIALACGFNDQTGMTRAFRQELRISPLRYRQRFGSGSPR